MGLKLAQAPLILYIFNIVLRRNVLKKNIKFKNIDGNEVTEDFYFNLTKAELMEMEVTHPGGFHAFLDRAIQNNDIEDLMMTFKQIILMSYGVRTSDGRFRKSKDETEMFASSEAFSNLFMSFAEDTQNAIDFINGILPEDMRGGAAQEMIRTQQERMETAQKSPSEVARERSESQMRGHLPPQQHRESYQSPSERQNPYPDSPPQQSGF